MSGKDYTHSSGHVFRIPSYLDDADVETAFTDFADSIADGIGSGIDFPSQREGQVIQGDDAQGWKEGMAFTVSLTVPEDSDGEIGDVVFVTGDDDLKDPGAGSAVVSGHNGANYEPSKVIDGQTYDIYTFTDDTRDDMTLTVDSAGMVDVLIVGGGGGGSSYGGGGGAGGHLEIIDAYLPEGQSFVGVGSGGNGGVHNSGVERRQSHSGRSSYVGPFYSPGGGAGGASNIEGFPGGSGGGGVNGAAEGPGVFGIGNAGGRGHVSGAGGGGGGAGTPGETSPNAGQGGAGGDGGSSSITGTPVTRAGGGGGGAGSIATGGSGGGGNGGGGGAGTDATSNTGSGGGGGWNGTGGNGGSGIVIVRVKV